MILRFLHLFPQFREQVRLAEYERERARKAEQANIGLRSGIDELRQDLAAEQSLVLAARTDRDFWRTEARAWQDKQAAAVEKHITDLQQEVDWRAMRLTGRTVHGVAPAQPEPPKPDMSRLQKHEQPKHPRSIIREKTQQCSEDLTTFFNREQQEFLNNGHTAPQSEQ